MDEQEESVAHVFVNGSPVPVDQVEFLDIEEDFTGRDIMTFVYEGKECRSHIVHYLR